MLFDQDVKQIATIPIDIIESSIKNFSTVDWKSSEFNRNEVTLKDGRLCLLPYLISKPEQLTPSPNKILLIDSISNCINFVSEIFKDYKIVRGELVNLKPGVSLVEHIDIYWFHKESRRIHIPLMTNRFCELTFEGRPYHLEVGKIYEINNRVMHSGYNNGETDRIHIILDFMPIDVFNDAVVQKQNFMEIV